MDLAWAPDGLTLLATSTDGTIASLQFTADDLAPLASKKVRCSIQPSATAVAEVQATSMFQNTERQDPFCSAGRTFAHCWEWMGAFPPHVATEIVVTVPLRMPHAASVYACSTPRVSACF